MATDDEIHQLQRAYDVTPSLAHLLHLLAHTQRVTAAHAEELGLVSDTRVSIHRLRRIMAPHGISVRTSYATGYWLSDEDQAKVKAVLKVAA